MLEPVATGASFSYSYRLSLGWGLGGRRGAEVEIQLSSAGPELGKRFELWDINYCMYHYLNSGQSFMLHQMEELELGAQ